MAWTDDRVEKLRELWDKGLSASQIAKELAEGVTRNAGIGKAHLLGLASRPSPVKSDGAKKAAAAKKTVKASAPPKAKAAAVKAAPINVNPMAAKRKTGGKITILDLSERICKWPIGHPGEENFHFCGEPSQPTHPYCSTHCLEAYQVQQPRRANRRLNRGRVSATPVK
jgi:GcrA cell cycle regulator